MKDARPAHRYANTRLPGQVSISGSRIDGRLFIPKTYEADAKIHALLGNINHRKSGKTEDDLDVEVVQRLSDQLRSVDHDCEPERK